MARDTLVEGSTLTAIADAIREKTETTDVMYPSEMAGKILAIEGASAGQYIWKKSEACLESSGTQYVDLGVKPNQNTKVEVDFEALSGSSSDPTVFGAWDTQISNAFMFIVSKTLGSCLSFYGSNYKEHTLDMTDRHTAVVDKNVTSVDGNTVITLASATFSTNYPMYLFAYNNKGNAGNVPSAIKIYSCKVYDNGSLVRDVIPYVDGDGVACMYDKVSASCLYNAGTGVFAVSGANDFVYVADDDENKYPDGGIVDGYYYERVEIGETGESGTLVSETSAIYTKDSLPEGQITSAMGDVEVVKFKPKYSGTVYISARLNYQGNGSIYIKINGSDVFYKSNSSGSSSTGGGGDCQVVKDEVYTVTVNTTNTAKCTYTNFIIRTALSSSELLTII